jgi:hypothetical protein
MRLPTTAPGDNDLHDPQASRLSGGGDAFLDKHAKRLGYDQSESRHKRSQGEALDALAQAPTAQHGYTGSQASQHAGCREIGATVRMNREAALTSIQAT